MRLARAGPSRVTARRSGGHGDLAGRLAERLAERRVRVDRARPGPPARRSSRSPARPRRSARSRAGRRRARRRRGPSPRSTTTRVKPSRSPIVRRAAGGRQRDGADRARRARRRAPRASVSPTVAISGSVKHDLRDEQRVEVGRAAAQRVDRDRAPRRVARWASAGPATMSPIAATRSVARRSAADRDETRRADGDARALQPELVACWACARPRRATTSPGRVAVGERQRAAIEPSAGCRCAPRRRAPRAAARPARASAASRCGRIAVLRLDDRHARAELGERGAELDADVARADDGDRLRQRRRARARSVEPSTRSPSNGRPGSGAGREPVASDRVRRTRGSATWSSGVWTAIRSGAGEARLAVHDARRRRARAGPATPRASRVGQLAAARLEAPQVGARRRRARGRRARARARGAARRRARSAPCSGCSRRAGRRRRAPAGPPRSTSVTSRPSCGGAQRGRVAARAAADDDEVRRLGELADDHQRRLPSSSAGLLDQRARRR